MPEVSVLLYQSESRDVPLLDWMGTLPPKARAKCRVRLERLAKLGHELRRPEAEYLSEGIYELRIKHAGANYRMLYFFRERSVVVLSHGFSKKQRRVPRRQIERAIHHKQRFLRNPDVHTYREDL